jgi:hypothetical protein
MMQTLVVSNNKDDFERRVNEKLREGYSVVPGTLSVRLERQSDYMTQARYALVVER